MRTATVQPSRRFGSQQAGQILGEWQPAELRIVRNFRECRGLSTEQLEDVYQETALALYTRPHTSEEHLRNALRTGIKQRALRLHRDERRRNQILTHSAPGLRLMAEAQEDHSAPEPAVLAHEDRLIATEFLTELSQQERRVFGWLVEGLQYRAIATILDISVNEARNTARACSRKRERFQLLHDTGRLCGYRAQTIRALQNGQSTSEELAERAFAHLESCAHCRQQHKTNAKRLRRNFRDQAAMLLPPIMISHLSRLTRLILRARMLLHRPTPIAQGSVRERAVALLAGGGASTKIAVGVVTLSILARGAIATHILEHNPAPHSHHATRNALAAPRAPIATARVLSVPPAASPSTNIHHGVHISAPPHRHDASTAGEREPSGFAYLGVFTSTGTPDTSVDTTSGAEGQRGGGPFSP